MPETVIPEKEKTITIAAHTEEEFGWAITHVQQKTGAPFCSEQGSTLYPIKENNQRTK